MPNAIVKPFSGRQGMTLVEVMLAVLLFSVGILGITALHGISLGGSAAARKGMYNSVAAGAQIEQILAMAFDDERLADHDRGFFPKEPDHGPFVVAETGGTVEWEVEDDYPGRRFKRITVTVRWPDRAGVMRAFSYGYVKTRDLS